MSFGIKKVISFLTARVKRKIELSKYNDFTISEYFRRQGARIGERNRLEVRSLGAEPHIVSIGNHCTIALNVKFLTHDGAVWVFSEEIPDIQKFGAITIRDNCFIGIDSIVIGNVIIGPDAIVGAGSVVTKDVPTGTIVAGSPAKKISTIEEYRKKAVKIWEKQKPQKYFQGMEKGRPYPPEYIQQIKNRDYQLLKAHLLEFFPGRRMRFESV